MKFLGVLPLLNKLLSPKPDPRWGKLSPVDRQALRALLDLPAWLDLVRRWEAEYQSELKRLVGEKDPYQTARRQGRVDGMEKLVTLPYQLLEEKNENDRRE